MPLGARLGDVPLGLMPVAEAAELAESRAAAYLAQPVELRLAGESVLVPAESLGLRLATLLDRAQLVQPEIDTAKLQFAITAALPAAEFAPIDARAVRAAGSKFRIEPEAAGQAIDWPELQARVAAHAAELSLAPIEIPIRAIQPSLTAADLAQLVPVLGDRIDQPLIFLGGSDRRAEFALLDHLALLRPESTQLASRVPGIPASFAPAELGIDRAALAAFIESDLAPQFEQAAAPVAIVESDSSIAFEGAGRPGQRIDAAALADRIREAVLAGSQFVSVPLVESAPPVTVPAALAEQGIRDYLGEATTEYPGSPWNRQRNIQRAAELMNGVLIQPGAEFSFVDRIGRIDGTNGFVEGGVIQGGEIVQEFGGGVCQASTTIFRAALAAGFPITEQHPHSLKVQYYSPPGLDAAIYPGQKDFRFKNDTAGAILLRAEVVGQSLRVSFFGTRDARAAEVAGPFYPNGAKITNLDAAGLKMFWTRELTAADGSVSAEKYSASYRTPPPPAPLHP